MLDKLERLFVAANRVVLIAILAAMSLIVFANVALRYLTNDSLVWAEEVARHLMIWLTFVGVGMVMRAGGHIAIENLQDVLPAKAARVLRLAIVVAILVFCGAMIQYGIVYVERTMLQTTSATQIPFGYVYLAMPIGFALVIVHLLFVARGFVRERRFATESGFDAGASASL